MCARAPEVLDGQRPPEVPQDLQQNPGPVAPVAQLAQVRQRLLRRAHGVLQLRQLVTCRHTKNKSATNSDKKKQTKSLRSFPNGQSKTFS